MFGFAAVILVGTILLHLPFATADGCGLSLINAAFTATSAVCVTGLVVVDTGTALSTFGQIVVLVLIQIGGLGFMAFGTFFALLIGKKIYFRERLLLQEAFNQGSIEGIVRLVRYIGAATLLIEGVGAFLLAFRFSSMMGWQKGIYFGVFHAVSAFNNAGFDLFGGYSSFTRYTGDLYINLVLIVLIITGGLGFVVTLDVLQHRRFHLLSLHSKVVLATTAVLLAGGGAAVFLLESNNPGTIGALDGGSKVLAAVFQSVTSRTAGFNTINTASLATPTLMLIMVLMFIGGSPGSTSGGIKTSTFAALFLGVRATIKGEEDVTVFSRRLPKTAVSKAVTVFFAALTLVLTSTFLLTAVDGFGFMPSLFEAVSAFGTVGLSLGITQQLDFWGKAVVLATMFCGRLGPMTLMLALTDRSGKTGMRYPEDKLMLG